MYHKTRFGKGVKRESSCPGVGILTFMDLAGWRDCREELFAAKTGHPEHGQGEIYRRQAVGFPNESGL